MYSVVAVLAGLAATASAIVGPGDFCYGPYFSMYNRGGLSLSYQRLDPALDPGKESAHLHSFDGGKNLGSVLTGATLQDSTCTTAKMKQDKSLYWNPTLHFKNGTGFYKVPEMYKKVYYKFGDDQVNYKPSAFPQDFMMIAGESAARSEGDMVANAGISWACLGDNYSRIGDKPGFPSGFTSCSSGFATQLTFPSCWNGNPINPAEPNAHMAYPTGTGQGIDKCPVGFQKARFPAIFIEFWWDVSSFDGSYAATDMPWVLSNGDPTGMGFHADFAMGWEDGILEKAIAENGLQCGCGCGDDDYEAFFGTENVNINGDADYENCAAVPVFPGDDVEFMTKLPGCNPLQYGPAKATPVTGTGCSATAISTPQASYSSAATSLAAVSTAASAASSVASSVAGASSAARKSKATSVQVADVSSTAASSYLDISLGGKGVGSATATPASAAYSTGGASFVFLSETGSAPASKATVVAAGSSAASSAEVPYGATSLAAVSSAAAIATSPSEGGCKAPVYVTITPTITVTAGAGGGQCGAQTIYTTVTNTATVTVAPAGGYKHKHRRHLEAHLHKH